MNLTIRWMVAVVLVAAVSATASFADVCTKCSGKGEYVRGVKWQGIKSRPNWVDCDRCDGTGQVSSGGYVDTAKDAVEAVLTAPERLVENSLNVLCETAFFAYRNHVVGKNRSMGIGYNTIPRGTRLFEWLRPLYPRIDITRVKVFSNAYVPAGMAGITFGDEVYVRGAWDTDDTSLAILLGHEITHCVQYARFGDQKGFARSYFRDIPQATLRSMGSGNGLDQDHIHNLLALEREANAVEAEVAAHVQRVQQAEANAQAQRRAAAAAAERQRLAQLEAQRQAELARLEQIRQAAAAAAAASGGPKPAFPGPGFVPAPPAGIAPGFGGTPPFGTPGFGRPGTPVPTAVQPQGMLTPAQVWQIQQAYRARSRR